MSQHLMSIRRQVQSQSDILSVFPNVIETTKNKIKFSVKREKVSRCAARGFCTFTYVTITLSHHNYDPRWDLKNIILNAKFEDCSTLSPLMISQ